MKISKSLVARWMGLSLLILFSLPLLSGSDQVKDLTESSISRSEVARHVRFLASDELMGREAGTIGNDVASRYIAEVFRSYGLEPASQDGDFFQVVPLKKEHPPEQQEVILLGRKMLGGSDFIILSGSSLSIESGVVDVGYGLEIDEGIDLNGKIALTRFGSSEGGNSMSVIRRKRELLSTEGAVAIVEIYAGQMWDRFGQFLSRGRMTIDHGTQGDENDVPHLLIRSGGVDWAERLKSSSSPVGAIRISDNRREKFTSRNVVGIVQGSDPELRSEHLALTAHYDHVGVVKGETSDPAVDRIYNGARDNGMGTAALLAAARTLSENPPARSILFVAFTAEEKGLLGSRYFVSNPVVPLSDIIYVLNNDGAGYTNTSLVTLLGSDRTSATGLIEKACLEFDLKLVGPPEGLERLFRQSDNIVFAEEGVPAVTFSPGFESFGPEIREFYHQVNDHADETFDFEYLRQFSRAYALAGRLIADSPDRPNWAPGDEYSDEAEELYNSQDPVRLAPD